MYHEYCLDHEPMLSAGFTTIRIPECIPECIPYVQAQRQSQHLLICPGQPWCLPPYLTDPNFLSPQLSVHRLVDVLLLLFGMRVVMLVL